MAATESTSGHEVYIKIRAFPYYVDEEDPVTGNSVRREKIGRRGDTVTLSEVDYRRAVKFDAIGDPPEPEGLDLPPDADDDFDLEAASPAEVSEWIKDTKPTEDQMVEASNDQAVLAQKLMEGEVLATGDQPRKGVMKRLQDIVSATTGS